MGGASSVDNIRSIRPGPMVMVGGGKESGVFYEKKKNRKARKRATMSTEASLTLKYKEMAKRNGNLSREQVAEMAQQMLAGSLHNEPMSDHDVDMIMRLGGVTCNDEITSEDLPSALAVMINIKKENEAIHELFLSHDVDGSGDLPVSELVALLTELDGEEPSESDVEYVLAQVVVDGEGESRAIKESQLKPALACWYLTHGESETKPLQVVIEGRSGAGKSTQTNLIKDEYNVVMLDCAKILNDTSMTDTELGQKIKEAILAELAVPDELVTEAVVSRLAMPDCMSEGWILSGCPRTPAQAEAILNYAVKPDAYIMLEVDEAVATERLKLAGKEGHGSDEKIAAKMAAFTELTLPASEIFKEAYGEEVLVTFNGNRDAAEVHADIKAHLDGLIKSDTIRTRHQASMHIPRKAPSAEA